MFHASKIKVGTTVSFWKKGTVNPMARGIPIQLTHKQ